MSESDVKQCPKCGGEMEIGYLRHGPYWRKEKSLLRIGLGKRIFGYSCKNCGYVELYLKEGSKEVRNKR